MTAARRLGWIVPLLVVGFGLLPASAAADSCSMSTSGDWNTAGNWSCAHIPTTADQVTVGSGKAATVAANAFAGDLTLDAGTISLSGGVSLSVQAFMAASFGKMTVNSGTFQGTGTVTVAGDFSKTTAGQMVISDAIELALNDPTPTAAELADGVICMNGGGPVLHLGADFTIATSNANAFNCSSGHIQVDSGAELIKTGATTTALSTPIDNDGAVHVTAGTLQLNSPSSGTSTGDWLADVTTTLRFANSHTVSGSGEVGGAGAVEHTGGTLTLVTGTVFDPATLHQTGGTIDLQGASAVALPLFNHDAGSFTSTRPVQATTLNELAGTLDGNFTLTVPGGGAFTKTGAGQMVISNSATLFLQVAATLADSGVICMNGGGPVLHLGADFTIATSNANAFNCSSGHIQVDSGAELIKTGATTTALSTPIDNDGAVHVTAGTLQLNSPSSGTSTGDWLADVTTTLRFANSHTVSGSGEVGGAGAVEHTGGTLTLVTGTVFDPATLHQTGGTIDLQGASAVALPLFNHDAGSFTSTRPVQATTLNELAGTLDGNFTLTVPGGGAFTKTGAGQMVISNSATLFLQVAATLADSGVICMNGSGPVLHLGADFTIATSNANAFNCSSGHIQVDSGAELKRNTNAPTTISTPLQLAGTLTVASGQTINLNGPLDQTA